MTIEEAKTILLGLSDNPLVVSEYLLEALDMAIKSLEAEPCEDCISREEAKNLFWDGTEGYDCRGFTRMEIGEMLDDLPSVTPIIPEVENNYNIGYNCGYADAMSDVADMRGEE